MSKFKVTNPDEPIESDLYLDIPSKDPDTGIDQVDDKGNILVKRYVTRSINSKGIANIKNALPQINTNKEAIAVLDKYTKDNVASITSEIGSINDNLLGTQTDLSDLTQTVSVLQGKINSIQGIDIDVVQADVDALKKSAYLITGGVLKGDVSIQTPNTAVLTLTPSGSSSYASFSTTNSVLDCTTTWGRVFKVSEEGKYFYGLADKATQDALGQNIADNYIKDITGANATLTITKGTGTTSILSVNNVLQAQKAIADKNNNDITTTYATKAENAANLDSAKAYADTKKNEAITNANSYTDQEKVKYLPLIGGTLTGDFALNGCAIRLANDEQELQIVSGTNRESSFGARLGLRAKNNGSEPGSFHLLAHIDTTEKYLAGYPDGRLTWGDKNIVRSINGVNADADGNVGFYDYLPLTGGNVTGNLTVQNKNVATEDFVNNLNIIRKNDGNDYYDDSDITSLIYAGNGAGTLRNEIANGNFARVHPGQTIKGKVTGTTYIVVGCNIYLYRGDTLLTRNHLGLIPILLVGNSGSLLWSGQSWTGNATKNTTQGYAPWNADNENVGKNVTCAYKDSYMAKTVIPKVINNWLKKDFEDQGISVLTFRNLFSTGFDANLPCMSYPAWKGACLYAEWADCKAVLMSEPEVYGGYRWASSPYDSQMQHLQLPLFRHRSIHEIISDDIWLKDVASVSDACFVNWRGVASSYDASQVMHVCPLFLIA